MSQVQFAGKITTCYCCKKPLTLTQTVDPARGVTTESWECTDQSCIVYRQRHAKIPDPPKTK